MVGWVAGVEVTGRWWEAVNALAGEVLWRARRRSVVGCAKGHVVEWGDGDVLWLLRVQQFNGGE